MVPAAKFPLASRLTIVSTVFASVAALAKSSAEFTSAALDPPTDPTTVAPWVPVTSPASGPVKFDALPAVVAARPTVCYVVLGATHPNLLRTEGESYRRKLTHLARALGVAENVIFVNRYVPEDELRAYIGAADIYLTPYLTEAQISSGTLSPSATSVSAR